MSTEASLRLKHNKNLKLAAGNTKNSKQGRKSYSSVDADQPANLDRKRKRKYADQNLDREVTYNVKAKKSKALSKKGQNQGRPGSVKAKNNDEPSRTIWVSRVTKAATSKTKHPSTKVKDTVERVEESSGKWGANVKKVDSKYGVLKKPTGSKFDSSNQSQKKYLDASAATSEKRTGPNRKASVNDDSEVLEDQPKKRKRTIRLDPYDISNKRLDDGIVTDGHTKVEKKEPQKDAEMSKNAQFKAIKPSPSILKFVEDNLLGRRHLIELKRAGFNIDLSAPLDNVPFSKSSERERIEENVFRNKLEFFAAAKISSSFPPPDLPEIAFAGRSNVGKSSLLNSLTRQWGVARTSDKPGLTQTINFFQLGSKMCLVDLPGYGFAYAKEEVKDAWEELVREYVATRVGLKQVCLLVDTKWGIKPRDYELINLMERSRTKYQIVLTKTDMVFPVDVARRAMQIEENLKANKSIVQPVMMVSSKTGAGIGSLRTVLSKIARFARP